MTANGRGAGRGAGAAGVEESPAERSLGLIVPRVDMLVCAIDGPLAGLIVPRKSWNARINLARMQFDMYGRWRDDLDYEPAAEALIGLRYRPGGQP